MSKFERISIKGFRRLQNVDLEMRDLVVMIGANGSGKTSFLDAMSTLSASASGKLQDTLQSKGGLNEILTRGRSQELEIELSIRTTEKESLKLQKELKVLTTKVTDKVVKIKLAEVTNLLKEVAAVKTVKDNHVLNLLRYHELIKELKKA